MRPKVQPRLFGGGGDIYDRLGVFLPQKALWHFQGFAETSGHGSVRAYSGGKAAKRIIHAYIIDKATGEKLPCALPINAKLCAAYGYNHSASAKIQPAWPPSTHNALKIANPFRPWPKRQNDRL